MGGRMTILDSLYEALRIPDGPYTLWLGRVCGYPRDFITEIELGSPLEAA